MNIKAFFDPRTFTLTYVVFDEATRDAVIIDPVHDFDPAGCGLWSESVDQVVTFVKAQNLKIHFILETHAHADHLSGSQLLKAHFPDAKLAIGHRITDVQELFKGVFDLPEGFATDGSQFDMLLDEGPVYQAGSLDFDVLFTPGHTPACTTFRFGDALFTGDTMFMPDFGTGRCDFPAGSAADLYDSITKKIYAMPDETRIFVGHDYQPGGRELAWETTVGESKAKNIQLPSGRSRADFIKWRTDRDMTLDAPKLLFQSVQVNVDAGRLPEAHENGIRYLKMPLNVFRPRSA